MPEKTIIEKICTPVFITALFATARARKKRSTSWRDEWIKEIVVNIYHGILFRPKEKCI